MKFENIVAYVAFICFAAFLTGVNDDGDERVLTKQDGESSGLDATVLVNHYMCVYRPLMC